MLVAIISTNFCVMTDVCPFVLIPNTTIVFYDVSSSGAMLHNRVVDWGLQPCLVVTTAIFYVATAVKIVRVKKKVHSRRAIITTSKKTRLEHSLFLQGLLVTIPHTIVIVVYHISFYSPSLPKGVQLLLDFIIQFLTMFGVSLNPTLHLVLNKDLRTKTIQSWCSKTLSYVEQKTNFEMSRTRIP